MPGTYAGLISATEEWSVGVARTLCQGCAPTDVRLALREAGGNGGAGCRWRLPPGRTGYGADRRQGSGVGRHSNKTWPPASTAFEPASAGLLVLGPSLAGVRRQTNPVSLSRLQPASLPWLA